MIADERIVSSRNEVLARGFKICAYTLGAAVLYRQFYLGFVQELDPGLRRSGIVPGKGLSFVWIAIWRKEALCQHQKFIGVNVSFVSLGKSPPYKDSIIKSTC